MKNVIAFVLWLSTFSCFAQAYSINVELKGKSEGKLVLAHYLGGNQYIKVDSVNSVNGRYQFRGDSTLKGGIYLLVVSTSKFYDFLVSGTEPHIEIIADTSDFLNSVKFKGSKENELLYAYRRFIAQKSNEAGAINKKSVANDAETQKKHEEAFKKLQAEVESYMDAAIKKNKGSFAAKVIAANKEIRVPEQIPIKADGTRDSTFGFRYYKTHFWDNIDFSDDRMMRTPFIQNKLDRYFKSLVYQVKDSVIHDADLVLALAKQNQEVYRYVLWWITNKYENIDIVGLDGVFVHLVENYYLKDATWLSADQKKKFEERMKVLKPVLTGSVFPQMVVYDSLGQAFTPNLSTTPFTIVYFYSVDCWHCKDAAPKLVEYAKTAKQKGITIYNVAVDHDEKKWRDFVTTYKMADNMYNLWDKGLHYDFRDSFDILTTPTSYILDADKRIIGKRISLEEFDKFIKFHTEKMLKGQ